MNDSRAGTEAMTPVKRALLEIRELREQLAQTQAAQREPIAVVGVGMRLPGGVSDLHGFAQLLWSGTDAVTEIPAERWSLDALYADDPDAPGKMSTRHGAFVDQVDRFDAEFFGISPREAQTMDPQQRLLLQVAWETIEDAGHAPSSLAGTRTGVYLGISNNDYGRALYAHPETIDAYFSTGNAYSVAAGRISYLLGLQGPSLAIDTACSSSLVAMHLACQGLRLHECDMALAGGVNLVLTPEMNINFSKARMMAPDGRCKTFDAAADGYVRGEGCAVVLLRRLSDALADGDRILAVLRGSAINQDGRSGGLTAPNGPAQEAVIRAALDAAGVNAAGVGYVETHGTGTPLGDPIEAGALGAVLGAGRDRDQALLIGSVKTNIGHLEAAAGVAGLLKVILALQRREIPPHLHFKTGSPHIDWAGLPLRVPTSTTPWAPIAGRRIAGVSSFGFSGTNAHLIVEEAPQASPPAARDPQAERPLHLLALSARDEVTLSEVARRYEEALGQGAPIGDLCFTANAGRSHFSSRLAVLGASTDDMRRALAAHHAGRPHPALATGRVEGATRPQVAFLFTGQGAQYAGMGRSLYRSAPAFREALDECAAILAPHLPRGLLDVMFTDDGLGTIGNTAYAQPLTFAIEFALTALWRSWGIEPVAVLGHSLGEYAAACVAGMLPLADGLRLVAERGRLTEAMAPDGAMATVFTPEPVVAAEIARSAGQLTIAGYNGPEHFVISGRNTAVAAALARLDQAGVQVKLLRVPHAAHSKFIEPILPEFRRAFESVHFEPPRIALVSNVTGALGGLAEIGHADYWIAHMRQPVRFAQSMQTLAAQGITHFIEVGPHPVLLGMGAECVAGASLQWLPSLRRDRADGSDLLESLQRLYVDGADVDWSGVDRGLDRRRIGLPTYPFRARRHWMDSVGTVPTIRTVSAAARWSELGAALDRQALQGPLDLNASSYPAKWDCMARLTAAHAVRTLREAGLFASAGERRSVDEVLAVADIGASYRHLVRRWLDRLVGNGLLQQHGDTFSSPHPLPDPALPALWFEAERHFDDNRPLLAYVRHCGELVGPVLRGQESPLETLFPQGSFELAEGLYQHSTTMRYINGLAAAAFESLGAQWPPGRPLRILEVGAGTGGTTAALLPVLPADRSRYHFTDVSELFTDRARALFHTHSFMSYGRFDLDQDPAAQGLASHGFDAIVSANAVHASTDLRLALQRLRSLLAPGGLLLLVESTIHLDWFDMTTGLIEGWQHFADDLRDDNPLLPPDTWRQALLDADFDAVASWPGIGSPAEALGQHLIVARVSGEPLGAAHAADSAMPQHGPSAEPAVASVALAIPVEPWRRRVLDALPADRPDVMRDFVRASVVRVLRLDANEPPGRHDRLMDLGFDSLMAVQLRNLLGTGLELDRPLPATLMFDHPTIDALAVYLLARLAPPVATPIVPAAARAASTDVLGAEAVAAMSDADIESLLLQRLESS